MESATFAPASCCCRCPLQHSGMREQITIYSWILLDCARSMLLPTASTSVVHSIGTSCVGMFLCAVVTCIFKTCVQLVSARNAIPHELLR